MKRAIETREEMGDFIRAFSVSQFSKHYATPEVCCNICCSSQTARCRWFWISLHTYMLKSVHGIVSNYGQKQYYGHRIVSVHCDTTVPISILTLFSGSLNQ